MYDTNFLLMQEHKYSLEDLENMIPWERTIYVSLLVKYVKEKNEKMKEQQKKIRRKR
jgi:hypothetical protein